MPIAPMSRTPGSTKRRSNYSNLDFRFDSFIILPLWISTAWFLLFIKLLKFNHTIFFKFWVSESSGFGIVRQSEKNIPKNNIRVGSQNTPKYTLKEKSSGWSGFWKPFFHQPVFWGVFYQPTAVLPLAPEGRQYPASSKLRWRIIFWVFLSAGFRGVWSADSDVIFGGVSSTLHAEHRRNECPPKSTIGVRQDWIP